MHSSAKHDVTSMIVGDHTFIGEVWRPTGLDGTSDQLQKPTSSEETLSSLTSASITDPLVCDNAAQGPSKSSYRLPPDEI